ncbi:MAG: helix-turn-helix domain-containing protein [Bacillota bacterium]
MPRKHRNRTALLFLLSYMVVMVIPLGVSFGYFYPRIHDILIDSAKERAANSVAQTIGSLDDQLAIIASMPAFIFENQRIILGAVMNNQYKLKKAKEDLEQMLKTNTFISCMYLYIRADDYFIGVNINSFYLHDIEKYRGLYETSFGDWSEDALRERMMSVSTLQVLPTMHVMISGRLYPEMILFLAAVPQGRYALATAMMCVTAENLTGFTDNVQTGGEYFFWNSEGTLLYGTGSNTPEDILTLTDAMTSKKEGSFEVLLSDGVNLTTWASSARYGWHCMLVLPLSVIVGEANALQNITLILATAIIGACFLLIWLAMRINYFPIKRLAKLAPEGEQNDFTAIQHLITKLTDTNDELGERLNMAEPQAREALVAQLFSGNTAEQEKALRRAELFCVDVSGDSFLVVIAEYDTTELAADACEVINASEKENAGLIVAQTDQGSLLTLLLNRSYTAETEEMLSGAKRIAVGRCVNTPYQINVSYSSACAALDVLRNMGGDRRTICYDELPERTFNPRSYPLEVMQSLETAIAHGNIDHFSKLINQIENLISLEGTPPYFTRSVYFNTVNLIISGLSRYLGANNAVIHEMGMRSMLSHYNVPEMLHIMKATAEQLIRLMHENERKNKPVTDALDFIEHNIASSALSLQRTADFVGLSASAFSRAFKDRVGRNFKEYVDAVRILRAKTLLGETDTPIEQISCSVGYDTITSFYRMFKKYTGIAPGEFRQFNRKT